MSQQRPASPTLSISAYSEITNSSDYELVDTDAWSDSSEAGEGDVDIDSASDFALSRINSAENTNLSGLGLHQWNAEDIERDCQRVASDALIQPDTTSCEAHEGLKHGLLSSTVDLGESGVLVTSNAPDHVSQDPIEALDSKAEAQPGDRHGSDESSTNNLVFPDPLYSSTSSLGSYHSAAYSGIDVDHAPPEPVMAAPKGSGDHASTSGSGSTELSFTNTDTSSTPYSQSHALRILVCGANPKSHIRDNVVRDIVKMLAKTVDPSLSHITLFTIAHEHEKVFEIRHRHSVTQKMLSISITSLLKAPSRKSLLLEHTTPVLILTFLSPDSKLDTTQVPKFPSSSSNQPVPTHIYLPLVIPIAHPVKFESAHGSPPNKEEREEQVFQPRTQLANVFGPSLMKECILTKDDGVISISMLESCFAETSIISKLKECGMWTFDNSLLPSREDEGPNEDDLSPPVQITVEAVVDDDHEDGILKGLPDPTTSPHWNKRGLKKSKTTLASGLSAVSPAVNVPEAQPVSSEHFLSDVPEEREDEVANMEDFSEFETQSVQDAGEEIVVEKGDFIRPLPDIEPQIKPELPTENKVVDDERAVTSTEELQTSGPRAAVLPTPIKLLPSEDAFAVTPKKAARYLSKHNIIFLMLSGVAWAILVNLALRTNAGKNLLSGLTLMKKPTPVVRRSVVLMGPVPDPVPVEEESNEPVSELPAPVAAPEPTPPPPVTFNPVSPPTPPTIDASPRRLGLEGTTPPLRIDAGPPPSPNKPTAVAKFSHRMLAVEPYIPVQDDDDEEEDHHQLMMDDLFATLLTRHETARSNAKKLKRAMAKLWASAKAG